MGDWERAKRRFQAEFEREQAEVTRRERIVDDLRNEAKRLRQRAWQLLLDGKVTQARNALRRAGDAQRRADDAHEEHRVTILQGNARLLGKMMAMSYFAEEFEPH
jgi:hypothetical protein